MKGNESRFSACHPAVTFAFFLMAIVGSVCFQHPAYLAVSVLSAVCMLLTQSGRKALPLALGMIPLFAVLSAVNPLFNTDGAHILFTIFGRPYTLEALLYGMAVAGMLVAALMWFACYSAVMTSDKFTCLFGNLIPALSLILVMVLRLIPAYQRKAAQISGARRCVGKAAASAGSLRQRAGNGMTILSALTSWALEGAIITADSMRSRGYGTARRSSFRIYRWRGMDTLLLLLMAVLFLGVLLAAGLGWIKASYTPVLEFAPVTGQHAVGLAAYALLLGVPSLMNLWEAVKWKFLRSRI